MMEDSAKISKTEVKKSVSALTSGSSDASNPLTMKAQVDPLMLNDFTQEAPRPKYDKDLSDIVEIVRILNNMAPIRMPVYNFNVDEINGEYYYKPDGTLLLIREEDTDIIRDYYTVSDNAGNVSVSRILEHDKRTGRLRAKIEPLTRSSSRLTTSITIFDSKINNKYTIIQLSEGGIVNNISEFSGKGKSFQTLFRNIDTFKPARYLEGKDNKETGFEMVDCIFDINGSVARIKRYTNKREVKIEYTEDKKTVTVKTK